MNRSLVDQGVDMLTNDLNCDATANNPDSTADDSNENSNSAQDSNNNNISNNISINDLNACDLNLTNADSRVDDSNNNNSNVCIEQQNDAVSDNQNVSTSSPKKDQQQLLKIQVAKNRKRKLCSARKEQE